MALALAASRARAEGDGWSAARSAANWLAEQSEAVDIDWQESFVPNGPPPGLTRSRHPIWKVPGLRTLARPLRLVKGRIEERRLGALQSVLKPSRIIFVHVPKNAGSSVAEALYGRPIGHHSMQFLEGVLPRSFLDSALSFAILREPRLRLLSAFTYLKEMSTSTADIRFRDTYLSEIDDFEDFVRRLEHAPFRRSVMRWHHFREQCSFLADAEGNMLVDAIFSIERMDCVQAMLDAAKLSKGAVGKRNASSPRKIGEVRWDHVDALYREDLKLYDLLTESSIQVLRSPNFFKRHSWHLKPGWEAARNDERHRHAPAAR